MKTVTTASELRATINEFKQRGSQVGFVPTMGYLHEGHLSLVRAAKAENGCVVVSIYVNPTQFGPNEDFERYPRDLERDSDLLEQESVDVLFAPDNLYLPDCATTVAVAQLTDGLCGQSRPGHFNGVTTVVAKLFNLVNPDNAYFGQKDLQQALVIQRMVRDLDFPIEVNICPIVREKDGLAMSSRNVYLTEEQRKQAVVLSQALADVVTAAEQGERSPSQIREMAINRIASADQARVEYVELVDLNTLQPVSSLEHHAALVMAVWFGKTRLIDNCLLNPTDRKTTTSG